MNEQPFALYMIGLAAIVSAGLLTFNQEPDGASPALANGPPATLSPGQQSAMVREPQRPAAGLEQPTVPSVSTAPSASDATDIKPAGRQTPLPAPIVPPVAPVESVDAPAAPTAPIKAKSGAAAPIKAKSGAAKPSAAKPVDGFIVIGSFTGQRSARKHADRFRVLAPRVIAMRAGDRPVQRVVVFPKAGETLADVLARVSAGGVADAWALGAGGAAASK